MDEKNNDAKAVLTCNIRKYRKALNLTQEKLAELSGLNSIADLEAGRSNPNLSTITKIANSLGVEVWELFFDADSSDNQSRHSSRTAIKQTIKELVDTL
ncbi:MAG: helix-turn-helix transcriptional regulator [Spirochaetales bacterium]|nr:helix-turn-helix transcriptional regulator [Spirochaetales bacterium]